MKIERTLILSLCALLLLGMLSRYAIVHGFTPPSGWNSFKKVSFTETIGLDRVFEPVEIVFEPEPGTCSSTDEIRVIAPDEVTEIPSQIYEVVTGGGNITSCKVVFLANCSALSSATYYIIYNNPGATTPTYDGLRLYEEAAGDTYTVNATKDGIEKRYFRIFWKQFAWLWSNGQNVTWAGGQTGWEFSPLNIATLWGGYNETGWFGSNKSLSILNGGSIFVDFNCSEAGGSDLLGTVYDYNVTTTLKLRVYYQPDLNPLLHYTQTFDIVTNLANYTISKPYYLDFKLADRASRAIYKNFTWKNIAGSVTTISTEAFPEIDDIWSEVYPVGWWSFNGSRLDSDGTPSANIGFIPIDASGTILGSDYKLRFTQLLENDDHHCSPHFSGSYNGITGDKIEASGYIVIYKPVDIEAKSIMDEKILRFRYPLNSHPADITGPTPTVPDGIVDIRDISLIARYFGEHLPPAPTYCDITGTQQLDPDGIVDMRDISYAARAFGWQR